MSDVNNNFHAPASHTAVHHEHSHHHCDHGHCHHDHDDHDDHDNAHDAHWRKAILGLIWGLGLMALSIANPNIPSALYTLLTGFTTLMTLYLGKTVYQSAWEALKKGQWTTSSLYAMSTITIVIVSITSLFIPSLPLMFEAAPLVLGFWHLGEGIEHSLLENITTHLDPLDCIAPFVTPLDGTERETPVDDILPNDEIKILAKQVLPVDGVLLSSAVLYTTRINGSPYPQAFKAGDSVKAGMQVATNVPFIGLRATNTYQNSYLSLVAKNIALADKEKAPLEQLANRILYYFVPGLLTVAVASGITIGYLFTPALAIQCVVSVLVSACPCALSLITPLAVKIGMNKAAEKGIIFKNGKALQATSDVDTVVFDLNGTLTEGIIKVRSLRISSVDFLPHIALLESQSNHPVAPVIQAFVERLIHKKDKELVVTSLDKSHHAGINGIIADKKWVIGTKDLLLEHGINTFPKPFSDSQQGSIYAACNGVIVAQIALTDPLRHDALATVKQLKKQGKAIYLCTGADSTTAAYYANLLGIAQEHVYANAAGVVSDDKGIAKEHYIKKLVSEGRTVAMVGDASNDLTAIAAAHMGIAVRSSIGDTVTEHHAGIVVHQGALLPIAAAFEISHNTKSTIIQNLLVSLSYNSLITLVAGGLFVALGFTLNPALGVALMVLESTVVLANLYRFKQQKMNTPLELVEAPREALSSTASIISSSSTAKPQAIATVEPVATITSRGYSIFTGSPKASTLEETHESHLELRRA